MGKFRLEPEFPTGQVIAVRDWGANPDRVRIAHPTTAAVSVAAHLTPVRWVRFSRPSGNRRPPAAWRRCNGRSSPARPELDHIQIEDVPHLRHSPIWAFGPGQRYSRPLSQVRRRRDAAGNDLRAHHGSAEFHVVVGAPDQRHLPRSSGAASMSPTDTVAAPAAIASSTRIPPVKSAIRRTVPACSLSVAIASMAHTPDLVERRSARSSPRRSSLPTAGVGAFSGMSTTTPR